MAWFESCERAGRVIRDGKAVRVPTVDVALPSDGLASPGSPHPASRGRSLTDRGMTSWDTGSGSIDSYRVMSCPGPDWVRGPL